MIKLDMQSRIPIYLQLKSKIGELILLGEFGEDTQMPSVRTLARDLGINPNTVQKTYLELEREGVLYTVSGKGSFVCKSEKCGSVLRDACIKCLREAAHEAKIWGVSREQAVQTVHAVYEEGIR